MANDGVDLDIRRGGIHAVVGENGAGKTTLMRIVYGLVQPDAGTYELDGRQVRLPGPASAIALGIGMVHQRFQLVDELSALENLVLGRTPRRLVGLFDRRRGLAEARTLEEQLGAHLRWAQPVRTIGVGDRQRLEIMRLLYQGADVLIFDEPTSVLAPQEADDLFATMRRLASEGRTILFVTHKLREVFAVADQVTVMRRGRVVSDAPTTATDPATVGAQIIGEPLAAPRRPAPRARESAETRLRLDSMSVSNVSGEVVVRDVNLEVHAGEIVGLVGVEGNGQRELVEAVVGLRPAQSGLIAIDGRRCNHLAVRARRELGLGFISDDRDREGASLDASLSDNAISLAYRRRPLSRYGLLNGREIVAWTTRLLERFVVRGGGPRTPARALSGGNLQRLVVGRELREAPRVLVAAHPSRGVDVRGSAFIHEQLLEARQVGAAVLLISEDVFELLDASDRLVVLFRGRIVADLPVEHASPERLGPLMTGAAAA
jgi:simple sugar transport system ATP-binding protein